MGVKQLPAWLSEEGPVLKEHMVYDKTCRTLVNFDCKAYEYGTSNSHAPSSEHTDGYGSEGYGGSEYTPEHKCKRNYETKCYTTPRAVSTEYGEDRDEKVCEKLTERVPSLLRSIIVMMNRKRFANWNKDLSLSK